MPTDVAMPTDEPFPPFDTLPAEWQNYLRCLLHGRVGFKIIGAGSFIYEDEPEKDGYLAIRIFMNVGSQHSLSRRRDDDVIISVPTVNNDYLIVLYRDREVFVQNHVGLFCPTVGTNADLPAELRGEDATQACYLIY